MHACSLLLPCLLQSGMGRQPSIKYCVAQAWCLQLVPAVTELILAEMWYLQIDDDRKPINFYINSTGTTRADGETVRPGLSCGLHACQL